MVLQDMDNVFQELAEAGAVNTWTYFGSAAGVMRFATSGALNLLHVQSIETCILASNNALIFWLFTQNLAIKSKRTCTYQW